LFISLTTHPWTNRNMRSPWKRDCGVGRELHPR